MSPTSNDHIVKSYDSELKRLDGEIQRMGGIAIAQLDAAIDVLQRRDSQAAMRVVANDEAIDTLEHEVSHDVLRLLALRQPMARDLREVYAALRISSDIERIGDYAANVAKRSIVLNQTAPVSAARGLPALAKLANTLVREALEAYTARDADRAMAVRSRDAELDAEYTGLFRELLTYMAEDPRQITACTHLLFMAKNIERIGDHATNIAENTWFWCTASSPKASAKTRPHQPVTRLRCCASRSIARGQVFECVPGSFEAIGRRTRKLSGTRRKYVPVGSSATSMSLKVRKSSLARRPVVDLVRTVELEEPREPMPQIGIPALTVRRSSCVRSFSAASKTWTFSKSLHGWIHGVRGKRPHVRRPIATNEPGTATPAPIFLRSNDLATAGQEGRDTRDRQGWGRMRGLDAWCGRGWPRPAPKA